MPILLVELSVELRHLVAIRSHERVDVLELVQQPPTRVKVAEELARCHLRRVFQKSERVHAFEERLG